MITVWIHGANSSPVSFNYTKTKVKTEENLFIKYDEEEGYDFNVEKIKGIIEKETKGKPCNIIAHSLGSLIAVGLYYEGVNINKMVCISGPYGGLESAVVLSYWVPSSKLIKDLHPRRPIYSKIKTKPIDANALFIVTTGGANPVFGQKNDGVLTINSQTAIPNKDYVYVELNHSEILNCDSTGEIINSFINS